MSLSECVFRIRWGALGPQVPRSVDDVAKSWHGQLTSTRSVRSPAVSGEVACLGPQFSSSMLPYDRERTCTHPFCQR